MNSDFFSEAECPPKGQKKGPSSGVGVLVMQYLRSEFPNVCTPKMVSAATGQEHEAVKKWLQRNHGTWVTRKTRGWYRARADTRLLGRIGMDPLKVHALQVSLSPSQGRPPAIEGQRDSSGQINAQWQGRKLTAQPQADGGLFVSLRASTDPMDIPTFGQFTAWLYGVAGGGAVRIKSFDLATDTQNHLMRMRGAESMELGDFHGATVKLYNKQVIDATRLETCFHRLDLGVAEAANILNGIVQRPEPPLPAPAYYGPTSGVTPFDFI